MIVSSGVAITIIMAVRLMKAAAGITAAVSASFNWVYGLDSPASVASLMENSPDLVDAVDAERAHRWAVRVLSWPRAVRRVLGLVAAQSSFDQLHSEQMETTVFGKVFPNPVGMAAGFDKHAQAMPGVLDLGFGFMEVGSVTPLPQDGNPTPRVFRLREDNAVINRYGFNSDGNEVVAKRLARWAKRRSAKKQGTVNGVVGVNLGKNKLTVNAAGDYVLGVESLGGFADYLVVNVSSPNTPGLRALQHKDSLRALLHSVQAARNGVQEEEQQQTPPPLLVKIAPDLTYDEQRNIADVCLEVGVDGLIVSNTTVERPSSLRGESRQEAGGLSGAPLTARSTALVGTMYKLTRGGIPIIGVGGISSGQDAYDKIRQGASLVQLYTSCSLKGPRVVSRVKRELSQLMDRDGFARVSEAVGVDVLPRAAEAPAPSDK